MKATLTFDLDEPSDAESLKLCLNAAAREADISALDETLRRWVKDGFPDNVNDLPDVVQYVRQRLADT